MLSKRILSIQSHVVSGYVGNKSAAFPLQVLEFDVDTINSVQLSNHTGYRVFKGQVLHAEGLKEIFDGLVQNKIDTYSHLLTGYCGSESFLKEVVVVTKLLKEKNPNLIYVCDPVMGDNGQFYVPESLLPVYRDDILPLANIATPNQFEAELITGIKISNEKDAYKAMKALQKIGPEIVVLTSLCFGDSSKLVLMAANKQDTSERYLRLEIPKLDVVFTGTGDLVASLLLAWLHKHPNDLKCACEKAISTTQAILKKTLDFANNDTSSQNAVARLELRLVQSIDIIRHPCELFKAEWIQVSN